MGENPMVPSGVLASPLKVFSSFGELYTDNDLVRNTTLSLALNYGGYIKAILWAIPLGFLIGLSPIARGLNQYIVDAVRFIPLTGLMGLFIIWYGIGATMKINFLAFGIFIYLLPTVIIRVNEVNEVYVKTVYTLGATKWQTIRSVFFPAVISKLSDDIRVLTAISWTYIIVAENAAADGGIGQLFYSTALRKGRIDKVFALLLLIMIIGLVQDRIFAFLDRKFFPHKYQIKKGYKKSALKEVSALDSIWDFGVKVTGYGFIIGYLLLTLDEWFGILGNHQILTYFFSDRVWVLHFLAVVVISIVGWGLYKKFIRK